ncbi:topoisomerase [Billgrantia diversa]|uniref:toprim domain-containing protein n=1 Tax=Halomonas sp. MCCC 1A13316 TaxID=2733487 RepID=UPI0018A54BF8|nr:toprim domain-containing protein [Halomonas sp. MCCC 1A13316]QOR40102.1 topoisomerase [Halomonas sp. MCCC 1A13316]
MADALARHGVSITPGAWGQFHRFDTPDKPKGNANGWYIIHSSRAASFGMWHLDMTETVTLDGPCDPVVAAQARLEVMRERVRHERERQVREAHAAEQARCWWTQARPADPSHPYLARKRLPGYNLRQRGDMLLVPMYHGGELVNLECIFPNGSKRTLPDGRVKGAASLVGRLAGAERVLVTEGWSTAAALHEAMGYPVVIARNADNLEPVARRLRQRLPMDVGITLSGDDDRHLAAKGEPNKGRIAARHAALAINAKLMMPSFCESCETCTDFADVRLCRLGGGE